MVCRVESPVFDFDLDSPAGYPKEFGGTCYISASMLESQADHFSLRLLSYFVESLFERSMGPQLFGVEFRHGKNLCINRARKPVKLGSIEPVFRVLR